MDVKENTVKETPEAEAERIRRAQAEERIEYTARRPWDVDPMITEVTVTINGKNYRVMYDEPVKIPRFVAEVLDRNYNESKKVYAKIQKLSERRNIGDF